VPRPVRGAVLAALWLAACAIVTDENDVAGRYRHAGPIAATLEVRPDAAGYRVRLEGGGSTRDSAASAADCVIEARGELTGGVLRARFGPVEAEGFSYGAAQAAEEGRTLEIVFEPQAAEVVAADTFGYCGLEADFAGRYPSVD
jgi:hypothetical protein